jgi:hypothetical protein
MDAGTEDASNARERDQVNTENKSESTRSKKFTPDGTADITYRPGG